MPVTIEIDENDLTGFTEPARQRLHQAAVDYVSDLIEEANRIEAGHNRARSHPEVTHGMVHEASILLGRSIRKANTTWGTKIIRIAAGTLPLIVGIMYNPNSLQDKIYMMAFILLIAAAILAVTLSVLRE
jgi:hypothetical protein